MRIGTSLEDFFRFNAERGEYGEGAVEDLVAERMDLARKREAHAFERTGADGTVLKIVGQPLPDGGFITTYADITERRRAQQELESSTELLNRLLDHSPAIIAVRDIEGRFQVVNRAYEDMFGVSNEELRGKTVADLMPEEFAADLVDYDRQVIESGEPMIHEHPAVLKHGGDTLLSVRFPIKDRDGTVVGVGSIATDITKFKQAELELIRAKEFAEHANRAKSEFLANMSHELRTPLNSIIGFASVLTSEVFGKPENPIFIEYSRDIQKSGEHLLQLISDLLDLSRIEIGETIAEKTPLDLRKEIEAAIRMVWDRTVAAKVRVSLVADENLPPLHADPRHFKQVLLNLLGNAIKFTPAGGMVIINVGTDDPERIEITVADTGIGIMAKDIPKIFEPFGQVADSLTRNHEGAGLGLPIVKSLVELHGGTIRIESEPNGGTQVITSWPNSAD